MLPKLLYPPHPQPHWYVTKAQYRRRKRRKTQTTVAPDISEVCADNITEPIGDNTERVAYFHSLPPMNYLLNCLCKWRSLILSQRY